jgi:hypothetical protein
MVIDYFTHVASLAMINLARPRVGGSTLDKSFLGIFARFSSKELFAHREDNDCLGMSLCKRMKQISLGKQRHTKNSTPEIEVMSNAMLPSPMHPRKQAECFAGMSKDDHHETRCAE